MALELVLTEKQTFAVEIIERDSACFHAVCKPEEWQELISAGYCWKDGSLYRAHETYEAPGGMCLPDLLGHTSEAADRNFEEMQHARFENGSLQL